MRAKALALRGRLTADYTNDEDFIQRPGRLREDIGGLLFAAGRAAVGGDARRTPPASTRAFAAVMRDLAAFERDDVARADAALARRRKAGARDERRQTRRRAWRRSRPARGRRLSAASVRLGEAVGGERQLHRGAQRVVRLADLAARDRSSNAAFTGTTIAVS